MENNFVITIGRQLGSGGLIIGKRLAEIFNIKFYDSELLKLAAKESGICEECFKDTDEHKKFDFLGRLFTLKTPADTYEWSSNNILSGESLFKVQSDIIKKLADDNSSVFVGRCADYILRDNPNCYSFFLTAELEDRIKRVSKNIKISEKEAMKLISHTDKKRAEYYNYYTNKNWGNSNSYNFCINTSILGIEDTVKCIMFFLEKINKKC
ncbi:MAG: cytidylate kinase-like family protein [Bacteroidales bacterium]|jgi:cytidylate kinase|nr:cytidylate kinase-like family protein [Bacteroidales bacterium]